MPLPIALGGRSISSQTLEGRCGRPETADDGKTKLDPQILYESIGWAVCPNHEWSARVVCGYYDLMAATTTNDGMVTIRDCTMVEVTIQISPLARPLSTDYRETTHHLKLFEERQELSKELLKRQPQVLFSGDRRNLAVLISHPHQNSSAVVIFQLRKPRTDLSAAAISKNSIPVPSYIQKANDEDTFATSIATRDPPAVATHPRFVSIWGITAMACSSTSNPSIFVAARRDASFVWLDARNNTTVAVGHLKLTQKQRDEWLPISTLRISPISDIESGQGIMVTCTGSAIAVKWDLQDDLTWEDQLAFTRVKTGIVASAVTASSAPPENARKLSLPALNTAYSKSSNLFERLSPVRNVRRVLSENAERKNGEGDTEGPTRTLDIRQLNGLGFSPSGPVNQDVRAYEATASVPISARQLRDNPMPSKDCEQNQNKESPDGDPQAVQTRGVAMRVFSVLNDHAVQDVHFTSIPSLVCLLYDPSCHKGNVAEIFRLREDGAFESVVDLQLAREQLLQASSLQLFDNEGNIGFDVHGSPQNVFGLDHDVSSDTFAISITYYDSFKWVGCLWNWRHNVLGWTIQQPLRLSSRSSGRWNRLYFCLYPHNALHLTVLGTSYAEGGNIIVRKESVAAGILSPRSQYSGLQLESNSLVLASDCVYFPKAVSAIGTERFELDWKVAALPAVYRNNYGPPGLVSIGRQHGHSIAVASSLGVCILDRHSWWRQFGTPNEEKSFQVIAMEWWEGSIDTVSQWSMEDLLFAIIKSNDGCHYLSCWSSKRLDLAHQLLVDCPQCLERDSGSPKFSWGIPLDVCREGFTLSLLSEPYCSRRRGVVLVTSKEQGSLDLNYQVFRLQVSVSPTNASFEDGYLETKPYVIKVHEVLDGSLRHEYVVDGLPCSTFLAGASFDFDLESADSQQLENEEAVATIGVVRFDRGLDAIVFIGTKSHSATILNGAYPVKSSVSDIVCRRCLHSVDLEQPLDAFVWKVEFMNGETYSWMVPYRLYQEKNDGKTSSMVHDHGMHGKAFFHPPRVHGPFETSRFSFGIICHIGTMNTLMQQSSSGTQSNTMLGQAPNSGFGCLLRAGQRCRTVHSPRVVGRPWKGLESEVYEPSQFEIVPPIFVSSLYMFSLEAACLRTELPMTDGIILEEAEQRSGEHYDSLRVIERHLDFRLRESRNKDASMMALRLLVFRFLEKLSHDDKKNQIYRTDESKRNFLFSLALFAGIVDTVRQFCTNLQFACLVVEVGRQVEPSLLAYLFPLPFPRSDSNRDRTSPVQTTNVAWAEEKVLDRYNVASVEEVFRLSAQAGSLQASSSCLPLFNSPYMAQRRIYGLLEGALDAFIDNVTDSESTFDHTVEERRVIADLFRFGIRVEDAVDVGHGSLTKAHEDGVTIGRMNGSLEQSEPALRLRYGDHLTIDCDGEHEKVNGQRSSLSSMVCVGSGRRNSSLMSILGSMFGGSSRSLPEEAVRRAASSFIGSQRELASTELLDCIFDNESHRESISDDFESDSEEESTDDSSRTGDEVDNNTSIPLTKGVATVVGAAIMTVLRRRQPGHWSTIGAIGRMLMQSSASLTYISLLSEAISETGQAKTEVWLRSLNDTHDLLDRSTLTRFLTAEIDACSVQLCDVQDCVWIADLVFFVLDRIDETRECQDEVVVALVLTGVVATCCSGKAASLLESLGDSNYMTGPLKAAIT